jgi:hypothetical protein
MSHTANPFTAIDLQNQPFYDITYLVEIKLFGLGSRIEDLV